MGHRATASHAVAASVETVLDVALTVEDMVRWFPLPIQAVDAPEDGRLRPGDVCQADSVLAGRRLRATIEVLEASPTRYEILATGPLRFCVKAAFRESPEGCLIDASVDMRSAGGLSGRLLEGACRPLLGAGLRHALDHLAHLAEARRPLRATHSS